jgi:thiol:disulfide interchange protein DsbD
MLRTVLVVALLAGLSACGREQGPLGEPLAWTTVRDAAHLTQELERAKAEGKPVVVEAWGEWCVYCHKYDDVFRANSELKRRFEAAVRLKIDVTEDPRLDLREVVGMPNGQPYMVFLDRKGRRVREADVTGFFPRDTARALLQRLDLVD